VSYWSTASALTSDANFVFSGGNLAIGTTSAATKLEVSGTAQNVGITVDAPTGYYAMQYFAENGVNKWHYEVAPTGSGGYFSFVESGVSERFRIATGGNVAIGGNFTPSARLHVIGAVNTSSTPGSWVQNAIYDNAATSTQNVTELRVAGTRRGSIRVDNGGNLVLSGTGTGATYLAYDEGTGGVSFGNGAQGVVGRVTSAGVASFGTTTTTDAGLTVTGVGSTGWTTGGWNKTIKVGTDGSHGTIRFPFNSATQFGLGVTTDGVFRLIRSSATDNSAGANYDLTVSTTGAVTISNTLAVSSTATVSSTLTANAGILGSFGLVPSRADWNTYGTGYGGAAIYNDGGSYQALMIVGSNAAGGVRVVKMWDNVAIQASGSTVNNFTVDTAGTGAGFLYVGNDVYLRDINSANTLGIYGQQDSTSGVVKLGSSGGTLSSGGGVLGGNIAASAGLSGGFLASADTGTYTLANKVCWDTLTIFATQIGRCSASSARYKNTINTITNGLDDIRALNPVTYYYNTDYSRDRTLQVGFIAEEVAAVNPLYAVFDSLGRPENVLYEKLTVALTKAVQQLDVQVQSVDARLAVVESGEFAGDIHVNGNANF
jgi:hypothetical protein